MIPINSERFICSRPILIHDPEHIIKLSSKLNDKQKDVQPDKFYIKFSETIPSNIERSKNILFESYKPDNTFMKKVTTKTILIPIIEKKKKKSEGEKRDEKQTRNSNDEVENKIEVENENDENENLNDENETNTSDENKVENSNDENETNTSNEVENSDDEQTQNSNDEVENSNDEQTQNSNDETNIPEVSNEQNDYSNSLNQHKTPIKLNSSKPSPSHSNSTPSSSPSTSTPSSSTHFEKVKCLYFENICLLKSCSIKTLFYIIAYLFNLNISNLDIDFDDNDINDVLYEQEFSLNHIPIGNTACHQNGSLNNTNLQAFYECISIGESSITIHISDNNDNKLNNYEEIFYKDYYQSALYVKRLLTNLEKQKIDLFNFHINISQLTVTMIYTGSLQSHSNIYIPKLFNMHRTSQFSKIYIHCDEIDGYLTNPRPMQYVKVNSQATNIFKGITSLYNTCSLYMGLEIDKGLILHHIEIQTNMTINLIFTNINSLSSYDELTTKIRNWISNNYIDLLKKIKIWECIYSIDFNFRYYIPQFNGITASVNIPNASISDIDGLNDILLQDACKMKFKTRTSLQMNGYGFYTVASHYKLMYLSLVHDFITSNIIYKDLLPTIHVGLNGPNDLTLTISNAFSYNELLYSFCYISSSFSKLSKQSSTSLIKSSELNIESIRKNSNKYGKKLLKILEKMDPRLFGPRKIGKGYRSFSGLCQKSKQRAVPITAEEYEYLRTIVPESVVNLKNQTYPDQRIYLFCPYKKFGFLNYHVFPNQLCIVRCTTKPSNKTQYNYCAESLGAEFATNIQNKYENKTITLYNPLITKGRKCRLPEELKMILVDYILLKLNISTNIFRYCLNTYGKNPFIIRRDPIKQLYSILTEYNENNDYILILQSEMTEDEYFIFLNDDTGEPLIFSESEEIKKFFVNNVRKTNSQYNFFNYLEKLFKVQLSQHYNKVIKDILNFIRKEFDIKYIAQGNFIRGVLWKNTVCLTPKFYWNFDESDIFVIPLFKAIASVRSGEYTFPTINTLNEEYITEIYQDYKDKRIHMVKFCNVAIGVSPFDLTAKWATKDIITFDNEAIMINLYNVNIPKVSGVKSNQIKINNIADVIKNYVYIYMINNESTTVEGLLGFLRSLGTVNNNDTYIRYTDNKFKAFVSWRSSRINREDFIEYMTKYSSLDRNDTTKNIYRLFQEALEFQWIPKEEMIVSKIITS